MTFETDNTAISRKIGTNAISWPLVRGSLHFYDINIA
jgi:hypothetical protein